MIEDYNLKVNINNSRPKYGEAGLDFNHLTGPTLVKNVQLSVAAPIHSF